MAENSSIIQDEVGTCQDCGKKLRIKKEANAAYPILTKDQLLQVDCPSPSAAKSPSVPPVDKPSSISVAIPAAGALPTVSDLVTHPVCMECLDRMISGVEKSIRDGETTRQDYTKCIASIEKEMHGLASMQHHTETLDSECTVA